MLIFSISNAEETFKNTYEEVFQELSQNRVGVSSGLIDTLPNPFMSTGNDERSKVDQNITGDHKDFSYKLYGLMDGRAYINDAWYKKGDMIGSYKIFAITNDTAILRSSNNTIKLNLEKGNRNVNISYK